MYGLEIMAVTKRHRKKVAGGRACEMMCFHWMDKVRNETEGKLRLSGLKTNLERQG